MAIDSRPIRNHNPRDDKLLILCCCGVIYHRDCPIEAHRNNVKSDSRQGITHDTIFRDLHVPKSYRRMWNDTVAD